MAKNKAAAETGYDDAPSTLPADEVDLPKKPPFCNVSTDDAGVTHFTFSNGEEVSINPNELSEEIQHQLMYHGLTQKVRDSFSSAKGDFAFALGSSGKVIEQLKAGQWTATRASGESKPKTTELAQALANLKGVDLATAQAAVERASEDKRKTWRNNAQVAAEIQNIRAAKARERAEKSKEETLDFEVA